MKFLRVKWDEVEKLCSSLAEQVRGFKPDVLVGISRGGLVPVRLLSDILDNQNVAVMKIEFYKSIGETSGFPKITQPLVVNIKGKKVLVVDDVADTGRSLLVAKDYLMRQGAKEILIATLHFKPTSAFKPDHFVKTTDAWLIYPWEVNEVKRELKKNKKKR